MDIKQFQDELNLAHGQDYKSVGISFTVTDEGDTSCSVNLGGLVSVPIESSDVHKLTVEEILQQAKDQFKVGGVL